MIRTKEEFATALADFVANLDIQAIGGNVKPHVKKDKDGVEQPTGEYFVNLTTRLTGTHELHMGDASVYSDSVQFSLNGFKVKRTPEVADVVSEKPKAASISVTDLFAALDAKAKK